MNTENKLPKRKHPRLKGYDYSSNGYYYVTICSKDMKCIFGKIEYNENWNPIFDESRNVGRGLAPAVREYKDTKITLSPYGIIAEKQLFALEQRYDYVEIDKFVIMPNHIHAIIILDGMSAGASPRPTLPDIMCAYKSLTTRECNKMSNIKGRKIFQESFFDKIIRNEKGYLAVWQYIDENPRKWQNDDYFV